MRFRLPKCKKFSLLKARRPPNFAMECIVPLNENVSTEIRSNGSRVTNDRGPDITRYYSDPDILDFAKCRPWRAF